LFGAAQTNKQNEAALGHLRECGIAAMSKVARIASEIAITKILE